MGCAAVVRGLHRSTTTRGVLRKRAAGGVPQLHRQAIEHTWPPHSPKSCITPPYSLYAARLDEQLHLQELEFADAAEKNIRAKVTTVVHCLAWGSSLGAGCILERRGHGMWDPSFTYLHQPAALVRCKPHVCARLPPVTGTSQANLVTLRLILLARVALCQMLRTQGAEAAVLGALDQQAHALQQCCRGARGLETGGQGEDGGGGAGVDAGYCASNTLGSGAQSLPSARSAATAAASRFGGGGSPQPRPQMQVFGGPTDAPQAIDRTVASGAAGTAASDFLRRCVYVSSR